MMNICRKITFFNNLVPPSKKRQTWEYEALGYYDGINIGEAQKSPEQKETVEFQVSFVKDMWEDQEKRVKALEGLHTSQMVHVFRTENGKEEITDESFWKNRGKEDEYPFLFITMQRWNVKAEDLYKVREKLERMLNSEEARIITYLTLDNNDLVTVIRSKQYHAGMELIDQFRRKEASWSEDCALLLADSFTVCGINKKCLNLPDYRFPYEDEKIDKVCIRVIEREPGSIQSLEEALRNQLGEGHVCSYPVPGCEDEIFLLSELCGGDFWRLYRDGEGILSSSNEEVYQVSTIGITTLILQERKNADVRLTFEGIVPVSMGQKKVICERLRKEFREKKLGDEKRTRMYMKAILQLVNSLQKYENMPHVDYTYATLYEPLQMLLKLIKEAKDTDSLDELSDFFYAVNLLTQNSIRLERQFTQSIELNARIYEAPVLLNTFYSVYFSRMRDVLNQGNAPLYEYEFMICPGMEEFLNVTEILLKASREKNLMLVEIPEHKIYDVANMLIVTAHEAAHFVGRDVRMREIRYEIMLEGIVKSVSTFMVLDPQMNRYCSAESLHRFEKRYEKELRKYLQIYCKKVEELSNGKRTKADRNHTECMKNDMWICAQTMLLDDEGLFQIVEKGAFDRMLEEEDLEKLSAWDKVDKIQSFKQEFNMNWSRFLIKMVRPDPTTMEECCLANIIDSNIHFLKETFADIMSILLLDLGVKEFFESFFSDSSRVTRQNEAANTLQWRLALVTKVMSDNRKEPDGKWNEENLKGLEEDYQKDEPEKREFIHIVRKLIENYLCDGMDIFDIYDIWGGENKPMRNLDRLYNPEIGRIFCRYLQCCCQKFDAKWKGGGYEEEGIEELRNVYTRLKSPDSIDNYIVIMRTEIEKFIQKHIIRKPEETLESEVTICNI